MNDEFLKQMGRVSVNFSHLEINLTFVVWGLISDNQAVGQAVTSGMSFNSLINLFSSLCKIRIVEQNILKEFEEIAKVINDINIRRNQLIHSFWGTSENDSTEFSRIKLKADGFKGLKSSEEKLTSEDLKKFADEIKTAASNLMDLAITHKE